MKKRALSLIMALLLLVSAGTLFASCGNAKSEVITKGEIELDVKTCDLLYAESASGVGVYKKRIDYFVSELKALTGKNFVARSTQKAEPEEDTLTILVGDTGYKESNKAKKAIKGDGFAIHVYDNRVAIVGSSDLLTLYALQYFTQTLLKDHTGKTLLSVPEKTTANAVPMVELASGSAAIPLVYSADCYEDSAHPVSTLRKVYQTGDFRDAPVVGAATVKQYVQTTTGLRANKISVQKDSEDPSNVEFLFGHTNRVESEECLKELSVYEHGFFVRNGKMVLSAWNDAQMLAANSMMSDLLKLATKTDKDGNATIAFPEGFACKGKTEGAFVTEFPKPDGVDLYATMDTSEDTLQYVYKGEGATPETYHAYVSKLKNGGYEVISENEIQDSLFATLVNNTEGIMLYVTYNAFAHEDEYDHDYDPLIRVVSASTEKVTVPDASLLTKPAKYDKKTNMAITTLELVGNEVGMCYIITLEDGSFIVFDGGASSSRVTGTIWDTLNARYELIFGKKPTEQDPIRIAAWVVTHSHGDHYGAPVSFWSAYANNKTWKMDYLIGNYPSSSAVNFVTDSDITRMSNSQDLADQFGFTFLKVHTGQKYYFPGLEIEVVMTYEDHAPAGIKNQNDTSTVLRFSAQATSDGVTPVGAPYTMVWLGDANNQQSRYLCAMYGEYLKSDMVQVGHHGNIGCETDLYETVKASVVWFPNSLGSFRSYVHEANKNSTWVYATDYQLIHESNWTKYIFVSGGDGKNPQGRRGVDLTLEFGDDGLPAFEDIYYIDLTAYHTFWDNLPDDFDMEGLQEAIEGMKKPLDYFTTADINTSVSSAYKQEKNFK